MSLSKKEITIIKEILKKLEIKLDQIIIFMQSSNTSNIKGYSVKNFHSKTFGNKENV